MLRKRKLSGDRPAFVILEDLQLVCKWPLLFLIAVAVPERFWMYVSMAIEWVFQPLNRKKLNTISESIRLSGFAINETNAPLKVVAAQTELNIQVFRDFFLGWRPEIEIRGLEYLGKPDNSGGGAVLWIAHFSFNSLVSKIALWRAGYDVWHVSRPEHGFTKSQFGIKFLNPLRVAVELKYIRGRILIDRSKPSRSMSEARRVLENRKLVSITAGAWEGQLLVSTKINNHSRIEYSAGAPRLAALLNVPLFGVFVVLDRTHNRFIVELRPLLIDQGAGDRELLIQRAADQFASYQAAYLNDFYSQWRDWEKLRPLDSG
jgi:hypothetical protein